jgi:uncharacterized membrane protein YfcA
MDARYSLTGFLIGFLIGATGMGGGALMTPLLILLLGVKPTVAVGSDLVYAAITKAVGAFQHHREKTVNYGLAWRLAIGSIPGSLLGVCSICWLQDWLGEKVQDTIMHLLGFMLILTAAALLLRLSPLRPHWVRRLQAAPRASPWPLTLGLGFVLGYLVGVTSVGSGTIFGVLLLVVFRLSAREMVGTDVYHAALLTSAAAGAHLWMGHVDSVLVAHLLLGSIPGVLMGCKVAIRLPEKLLRPVLAGVLLLSGWKMI